MTDQPTPDAARAEVWAEFWTNKKRQDWESLEKIFNAGWAACARYEAQHLAEARREAYTLGSQTMLERCQQETKDDVGPLEQQLAAERAAREQAEKNQLWWGEHCHLLSAQLVDERAAREQLTLVAKRMLAVLDGQGARGMLYQDIQAALAALPPTEEKE